MRCFFVGFAGFFVAAFVTAVAVSSYGDYIARARLGDTMAALEPLRVEIAEIITKQGSVGNVGASLKSKIAQQPDMGTDYIKVAADGTIVFRMARYGQVVVLEPSLRTGAVSWRCIGSKPEKDIPSNCR